MNGKEPLLSIIIPAYNAEKYIEECIESILKKNESKYEIIIINDGSKDSTKEILDKYAENENIRVFHNENHGVSYTRNFGIEKANGKWITFIDVDDKFQSDWFEKVNANLDDDKDIICFGDSYKTENNLIKEEIISNILTHKIDYAYLANVWSKVFKREFIFENKILFNINLTRAEDMLFSAKIASLGAKYKFVNESIYLYRNNITSVTHTFKERQLEQDIIFRNELENTLEQGMFEKEFINEMIQFCETNSIFNFASLTSNLDDRKMRKKYYKIVLEKFKFSYKKINNKKYLIIRLLQLHLYDIVTILFRIKTKKLIEEFVKI